MAVFWATISKADTNLKVFVFVKYTFLFCVCFFVQQIFVILTHVRTKEYVSLLEILTFVIAKLVLLVIIVKVSD